MQITHYLLWVFYSPVSLLKNSVGVSNAMRRVFCLISPGVRENGTGFFKKYYLSVLRSLADEGGKRNSPAS